MLMVLGDGGMSWGCCPWDLVTKSSPLYQTCLQMWGLRDWVGLE